LRDALVYMMNGALTQRQVMRKSIFVLSCVLTCLLAQDGFAAVKYKRFPHCGEGLVSAKTCECHVGTTGRYHFCHAGHYCHSDGMCRQ
jgi:hypothetical protein